MKRFVVNKNLILCFSSIHVNSDVSRNREIEYQICYEQLVRVVPDNYDIVYLDNTMDSPEDLSYNVNELKHILNNNEHLFRNNNLGAGGNKGMGELEMLITASENYKFENYDKICYLTGRRIITCPYVFDKTNDLKEEALISNPPIFQVINGHEHPTNHELYNDMFFAMKSKTMMGYVEHSRNNLQNNINNGIGSEQNLFRFINENKISYEWLNQLGFIRNDWEMFSRNSYTRNVENMQWT